MPRCADEIASSNRINCNKLGYILFAEGEFIDTFQYALENCKLNFIKIILTKKLQLKIKTFLDVFIKNTDNLLNITIDCYLAALSSIVVNNECENKIINIHNQSMGLIQ